MAAKKSESYAAPEFLPRAKLQPAVLGALEGSKLGAPADPVRLKAGWAVVLPVEERFPENPKVRAEAEKAAAALRVLAASEYREALLELCVRSVERSS